MRKILSVLVSMIESSPEQTEIKIETQLLCIEPLNKLYLL